MLFRTFAVSVAVIAAGTIGYIIGLLYAESDGSSIWKLIKEEFRNMKEEKAFLKLHPLCIKCQGKGKYKKAKYMWKGGYTDEVSPIALCSECLMEEVHKYK